MRSRIWLSAVSIILIASVVGSVVCLGSLARPSKPDLSIVASNPNNQLVIDNLTALSTGQVTFNVSNENKSDVIEAVIVNGERYSWPDGSQEDPAFLKNETKQWSSDIGEFEGYETIQVVVETTAGWASDNTTVVAVEAPTHDGSNQTDPVVKPQIDNRTFPDYIYDYYGGLGLFSEGIHVLATDQDPRTLFEEFNFTDASWKMLLEAETTHATDQDFISIILSRGDKPTGGYDIQIESFGWLESYPVKFLFHVNFTDPGEGIMVTEAFTNPLVLIPIGKLTPGEYNIQVPIVQYILNINKEGNPIYTQILTFAPVIWEQTIIINNS